MNYKKEYSEPHVLDKDVTLKYVVQKCYGAYRYLLRQWKIILAAMVLGAIMGYIYSSTRAPIYQATCTFVLEEQPGPSAFGQYSGLASMVGVDLSSGMGGGLFQGNNILELYRSRLMIERTLLDRVENKIYQGLLIDRYIEVNQLRERWQKDPVLRHLSYGIPHSQYTVKHDSIIGSIVDKLRRTDLKVEKFESGTGLVGISVISKDEFFAKTFAESLVENVNSFYIETKTKRSLESLKIFSRQADSVRSLLNTSIKGAASAVDANPNPNPGLQILKTHSQRMQVDVQVNTNLYLEIMKNVEATRLTLRNETPLIQIIDRPKFPLKKDESSTIILVLLSSFIATAFTCAFFIIRKVVSTLLI